MSKTFLVVPWLRLCTPRAGAKVWSLVKEVDPTCYGSPGGSEVKNLPASARDTGDTGLIPGLGSWPGGGTGNPLQYSCLENSVDRRAWWATVSGVTKNQTWLSNWAWIHIPSEMSKLLDVVTWIISEVVSKKKVAKWYTYGYDIIP